jgi:hypothetical protein
MQNISSISLAASTFPNYFDDLNELDREWMFLRNCSELNEETNINCFWTKVCKIRKGDDSLI